jgi:hypothetical protein
MTIQIIVILTALALIVLTHFGFIRFEVTNSVPGCADCVHCGIPFFYSQLNPAGTCPSCVNLIAPIPSDRDMRAMADCEGGVCATSWKPSKR